MFDAIVRQNGQVRANGQRVVDAIPDALRTVTTLSDIHDVLHAQEAPTWSLDTVAGRYVELSGNASLTACARLILNTQQEKKLAVWVGGTDSFFFPPDMAALGVDLSGFPIVQVDHSSKALRAVDILLRSGAFALIVLDLGDNRKVPLPVQSRLSMLSKAHRTALVSLIRESGDSLASLRLKSDKQRSSHDRFTCVVEAIKDKRHVPGWRDLMTLHGTDGLC